MVFISWGDCPKLGRAPDLPVNRGGTGLGRRQSGECVPGLIPSPPLEANAVPLVALAREHCCHEIDLLARRDPAGLGLEDHRLWGRYRRAGADVAPGVSERACLRKECPFVARRMKRELQHGERVVVSDDAVGRRARRQGNEGGEGMNRRRISDDASRRACTRFGSGRGPRAATTLGATLAGIRRHPGSWS
jgi:hypothetical protein